MTERVAIVLQARMGSTRLPAKVLEDLAGRTVLEHCVERLRRQSGLPVILATTTLAEDDCLERAAASLGVPVVRGAVDDVLERFIQVVRTHRLTTVIRATADNPAVDMESPLRTLTLLRRASADYVVERGLPYGAAVEAVRADALLQSHMLTVDPYDREHVTPFVRQDKRFRAIVAIAPGDVRCPGLRVTVDTADDLAFVRDLVAQAEETLAAPVALRDLIAVAHRMTRPAHDAGGVAGVVS